MKRLVMIRQHHQPGSRLDEAGCAYRVVQHSDLKNARDRYLDDFGSGQK